MDKYLSVPEIVAETGLSRNTVYALVKMPGFPSTRIGKRIIVSERAFREWMDNGGTEQKGA